MTELVPEPYDIRTSDGEREAVAQALRGHAVEGRLDAAELESRLETAYGATLRSELLPLVADLPKAPVARPREEPEPPWFAPVIPLAVVLITVWALTGAGYFWPMWPIAAMALATVKHGVCSARRSASARPANVNYRH
jgi:hypothetical protein